MWLWVAKLIYNGLTDEESHVDCLFAFMSLPCLHSFSSKVWHNPVPLMQYVLLTWPGSPLCMDFGMLHSGMTHWSRITACLQASFLCTHIHTSSNIVQLVPLVLASSDLIRPHLRQKQLSYDYSSMRYMTREVTTGCTNMSSVPVQWWNIYF